ncbi:MAG: hypothetical protein NZ933_06795 [Bacteroidia bacterium]|nr:hypothetical protein [Bacteroidia bacterium]
MKGDLPFLSYESPEKGLYLEDILRQGARWRRGFCPEKGLYLEDIGTCEYRLRAMPSFIKQGLQEIPKGTEAYEAILSLSSSSLQRFDSIVAQEAALFSMELILLKYELSYDGKHNTYETLIYENELCATSERGNPFEDILSEIQIYFGKWSSSFTSFGYYHTMVGIIKSGFTDTEMKKAALSKITSYRWAISRAITPLSFVILILYGSINPGGFFHSMLLPFVSLGLVTYFTPQSDLYNLLSPTGNILYSFKNFTRGLLWILIPLILLYIVLILPPWMGLLFAGFVSVIAYLDRVERKLNLH